MFSLPNDENTLAVLFSAMLTVETITKRALLDPFNNYRQVLQDSLIDLGPQLACSCIMVGKDKLEKVYVPCMFLIVSLHNRHRNVSMS